MRQLQKTRLVAVVVTHNRLEKLKETLGRLLADIPATLEAVLVVDNASTDGTRAWLDGQSHPALTVMHSDRNRGGAGGFNAGIRAARDLHDPDWMVLMDDDAHPEPGALDAFHRMQLDGVDAVAAAVYLPDGTICEMNRPSRNPFWNLRVLLRTAHGGRDGFHIEDGAYQADPRDIDVTSFVGFFISRAGIVRGGVPDAELFLYGDDAIYTLGLRSRGGRILFAPRIRFRHDCATFGGSSRRFRPLWKAYYHQRNLLILYRMAAGPWFWPALAVIVPRWLLRVVAHGGERRAFLRITAAALRDGLAQRTSRSHEEVMALAADQAFKMSR